MEETACFKKPACLILERVMGIEPTHPAWKAGVLPLNYTRLFMILNYTDKCSSCGKSGNPQSWWRGEDSVCTRRPPASSLRPADLASGRFLRPLPRSSLGARPVSNPLGTQDPANWWRGEDSNLRRLCQQIYSLPPLATREPLRSCKTRKT